MNKSRVSKNPSPDTATPLAKSTPKPAKVYRFFRADMYKNSCAILSLNQFHRKQKKEIIDVWWLYDDGGLTSLFPYIISTRRNCSECKLRVFTLANKKEDLMYEQKNTVDT
ncbi:bumetanide-sensitive sodium-(potassium)-chloride cotransporter-like [Rhodnius prolixus]|uniref:bumetanide-sensitive sodium-(potassium)-chloride cotransporter-like n=1 Tax=Rhodnius prolixus TaxID=13249 RepID=UPI003D18EF22